MIGSPLVRVAPPARRLAAFCCWIRTAEARERVPPLKVVVLRRGEEISTRRGPDPEVDVEDPREECLDVPVSRSAASHAASSSLKHKNLNSVNSSL